MTEQQTHLKNVIEQQTAVIKEIEEINNKLNLKKEIALKLQGIREYLVGVGVELPDEEDTTPPEELESEMDKADEAVAAG